MRILILDNYDSFTFNLLHYVQRFCNEVDVCYSDQIGLDEVEAYDAIILSPGPGLPKDAGISMQVVRTYAAHKKILGVCLGHQTIAEVFGAQLINLDAPLHGVAVETFLTVDGENLFRGLPKTVLTGRYHSWVVDPQSLQNTPLEVIATDGLGQVQALRHRHYNLRSVQFHPESVLTPEGLKMIENWIYFC